MKKQHLPILCGIVCLLPHPAAWGTVISLQPLQDTSLYSENDNSNAKGSLYAGQTAIGGIRRALLQFNVAGSIPAGATITSATLTLVQTQVGPASNGLFELHPLMAAWGEGTSAGSGLGSLATPGDATWNFRLFNSASWSSPGGDFGPISGTSLLGTVNTSYTFDSQPGMVADVQNWLNHPAANFGWLLRVADESPGITSAREFGSRESALPNQPTLTINFIASVPEPNSLLLLGSAALAAWRAGHTAAPQAPDSVPDNHSGILQPFSVRVLT